MSPEKFGNLDTQLTDAITMGAADYWLSQCETQQDDDQLEHSIRLCQSIIDDFKLVIKFHQESFKDIWSIDVFATVYNFYDVQIAAYVKPIVENCIQMIRMSRSISEDELVALSLEQKLDEVETIGPLRMETALFKLYLHLQKLVQLAPSESNELATFHSWFSPAVGRWLDIALHKSLIRIGKAVALDSFETVDSHTRHSSSAVDTVDVLFYQILTFWQQLNWPDDPEAQNFITKILSVIFYKTPFQILYFINLDLLGCGSMFHVLRRSNAIKN